MIISIITPNYNYAKYIGETIESVINQSIPEIELIVVDDGSTDESVSIINSYLNQYPGRIKLISQKNQGQTAAINKGLRNANGEIIGWINSDDFYMRDSIALVNNYFLNNPDVGIVFSDIYVVDTQGRFIYRKRFLKFNIFFGIFFGFANIMSSNAVFFRQEVFKKTGFLQNDLKCNMDGEFFSRLTKHGKVKKLKAPLAAFRKQQHTKASEIVKDWQKLVRDEIDQELRASYGNLSISSIISYENSWIIKIWFKIYRMILRFIKMHYLLEALEKTHYRFMR
jgi:glycosyltransferase involved in cell wall biosynthesis